MKIKTKLLEAALSDCAMTNRIRTTLPALYCCRISASDGVLHVESTSLDCWIKRHAECDGDLESVCVNHKALSSLVAADNSEEIELGVKNKRLEIKGRSRAALTTWPSTELPAFPEQGKPIAVNTSDLADGIDAVSWVGPMKKGDDRCQDMVVKLKPKMLECGSFGGVICGVFQRPLICGTAEFYFPCAQADAIVSQLRAKESELYLSDKYVSVKSERGTTSVLLVEKLGYDYSPLFSMITGKDVALNTETVRYATECCNVIYGQSSVSPVLRFEFDGTTVTYRASTKNGDTFEHSEPSNGEACSFLLATELLSPALRELDSLPVKLSVAESGVLFRAGDTTLMIGKRRE